MGRPVPPGTTIYIYALHDPDTNEIRYVGQTVNMKMRFNAHKTRGKKTPLSKWTGALRECGKKPTYSILETTNAERALWKEQEWIVRKANEGCNLLNVMLNPNCYIRRTDISAEERRRAVIMREARWRLLNVIGRDMIDVEIEEELICSVARGLRKYYDMGRRGKSILPE